MSTHIRPTEIMRMRQYFYLAPIDQFNIVITGFESP